MIVFTLVHLLVAYASCAILRLDIYKLNEESQEFTIGNSGSVTDGEIIKTCEGKGGIIREVCYNDRCFFYAPEDYFVFRRIVELKVTPSGAFVSIRTIKKYNEEVNYYRVKGHKVVAIGRADMYPSEACPQEVEDEGPLVMAVKEDCGHEVHGKPKEDNAESGPTEKVDSDKLLTFYFRRPSNTSTSINTPERIKHQSVGGKADETMKTHYGMKNGMVEDASMPNKSDKDAMESSHESVPLHINNPTSHSLDINNQPKNGASGSESDKSMQNIPRSNSLGGRHSSRNFDEATLGSTITCSWSDKSCNCCVCKGRPTSFSRDRIIINPMVEGTSADFVSCKKNLADWIPDPADVIIRSNSFSGTNTQEDLSKLSSYSKFHSESRLRGVVNLRDESENVTGSSLISIGSLLRISMGSGLAYQEEIGII